MKKHTLIYGVLTLALLFAMTGCDEGSEATPKAGETLAGKIIQINDDSLLLAGTGVGELYSVFTGVPVYDETGAETDASALLSGQTVEVGYSGAIMESYPAQLESPVYLQITGRENDLVGFYQVVLADLWNADEGLNGELELLAFDLSQTSNLTDGEKSALTYLISGAYDLPVITGTFDELCEQGYIDQENLRFENGMLLKLTVADMAEDSFTFDAEKWRSGTGAFYFHNCSAQMQDGAWSYTVGSHMIS